LTILGFKAVYISGAAVSASIGVPDIGLDYILKLIVRIASIEQFCRIIKEVANSSNLPVLADADTGFGELE